MTRPTLAVILARLFTTFVAACGLCSLAVAQSDSRQKAFQAIDPLFETYQRENHVPGLIYGVVAEGKLAYVRALGVQDTRTQSAGSSLWPRAAITRTTSRTLF